MRLMSWNVNGIKTLLHYSPWNSLKTYENVLNELGADIICFQETKITKKQVERGMAILPSFDSFFSSYSRKPEKGYSGTCIFTRRSMTVPIKAEEGISGFLPLDRKPEPAEDELIGGTLSSESIALNMQDVKTIDLEGRTTMVDLGLFVLINVYCPNETNEERLDFKLAFNAMLEARILNLIRLGREVIVLGDLNICRSPLDHCDPVRRTKDSTYAEFGDHPARKWFSQFVAPGTGTMVDLGRHFYPDRKSMFTHWETRINARETNYGSRIDYILATPGLLPWIKTCDIQPSVLGSDHCPVTADFHESITTSEGEVKHLWDHINPPGRSKNPNATQPEPPKLAARNYPEFSSEQRLLSNFFGKRPAAQSTAPVLTSTVRAKSAVASTSKATALSDRDTVETEWTATSALPSDLSEAEEKTSLATKKVSNGSDQQTSRDATRDVKDQAAPLPLDSKAPALSPSIDLTLDKSDSESEGVAGKKRAKMQLNGGAQSEKILKRTKSSSATPVPSGSGSGKSIIKTKTKKGQGTLAAFFKPPVTAAAVVKSEVDESAAIDGGQERGKRDTGTAQKDDTSRKMRKGKMRETQDEEERLDSTVHETGGVILSSDEDDRTETGPSLKEDDEDLDNLRKLATKGSRVNGTSSPSRAKRKQREQSGGDSTDSDVQEMIRGSYEASKEQTSSAWSSIFSPKVAPLCTMHGEPCKQWTVNKPGKNKNRVFWLCARPVGEGYDKGQSKEEVNPEYRCNYFKWESDIKRSASQPVGTGSKRKR